MKAPKILVFPGSNRAGSWNAKLAGTLTKTLAMLDCTPTLITLRDYPMPIFDQDLESRDGPPQAALKLARLFHEHDGVIVVSPEYNTSVTPLVKNTVDWISRVSADADGPLTPYRKKVFGLSSASPGKFGGIRGLFHLRATLGNCGAFVIPEQVSVTLAEKAFDDNGELADAANRRQLENFCKAMVETTALLSVRG
ncbi:MAG TPA: NAD(P)H-dependent oxidoreductase [Rhizobiaceae bacterium]|nr:NAD(P)H-dependent oxidoreductase [Rhizobiaceae bacterium]